MDAALADVPDHLYWSILKYLPARSIIRFSVVCAAWRNLFADPAFLEDHHRQQPAQSLTYQQSTAEGFNLLNFHLEALDLRAGSRRSVVRFTEVRNDFSCEGLGQLAVHGSCDGLLLISFDENVYICNPVTRRWAAVPPLHINGNQIAGLYRHGRAVGGEYRVLYRDLGKVYYVLTVGSGEKERRRVEPPSSSTLPACLDPPVQFRQHLHWPPMRTQNNRILVFDTEAEVFRGTLNTPINPHAFAALFEMNGKLALPSREDANHPVFVNLSILQEYESGTWERTHRFMFGEVETTIRALAGPVDAAASCAFVVSLRGDVLVECSDRLLHFGMNGVLCNGWCRFVMVLQILLQENVVTPVFFQVNPAHPFFHGM